jgi:predicted nucleic acid-binding protein
MRVLRVYVDTCVFGGAYDTEFQTATERFFDEVRSGSFHLIVSALVQDELADAPSQVSELYAEMMEWTTVAPISADALDLQQAYMDAGILAPKWAADALHVAMATVADCSLIVSWNFKHIVHFEKIPQYNAVNAKCGYRPLAIYSPSEVLHYGNEEEF